MLSKNNLKYILIIALGFFWCSSLYLTQEQYLANFASVNFVNIVELLFGSIAMALGILLFCILYRNNKDVKSLYILFMMLSVVVMIVGFATKNIYLTGICMCLNCFLGTAGFGAGYHFSLLSSNVDKKHRGRVFAIGYALGSLGTYLLILLPESFYSTISSLFLYIPIVVLNLIIVCSCTNLDSVVYDKPTSNIKSFFWKIIIIVLTMSLLSALSTDAIAIYTIDIAGGYGNTRVYYCLGLLIAGFLADKKRELFDIITLTSFVFSLLCIILLKDGYSIGIIAALSYFFVAFFVVFRTVSFVNVVDKSKSLAWAAAIGLMLSRFMEGILVLFEDQLINNYLLLIIIISILLAFVMILCFTIYFDKDKGTLEDKIKQIVVKYQLSNQEEKVLLLLVNGKNNQEISEELYISVYTVKRHVANIYQKTGMNKKNLKEICYNS